MDEDREAGLDAKMARVETLVEALNACPDPIVRAQVQELVRTLMEFHGRALKRMFEILRAGAEDLPSALSTMAGDTLAGSLLLLYGLHPAELGARIEAALEDVRPALQAHQGDVELVAVADGAVTLRLRGSCNGCASSINTLRTLIETAIHDRAPEVHSILVEGVSAA